MMHKRMAAVLVLIVACSVSAFAQQLLDGDWPRFVRPHGPTRFSIGVIGAGVFPIVTSDVVGPDAPEGSHKRTTISIGAQAGVEFAWEFYRALDFALSARGRMMSMTAFDGESVVHQHVDLVTVQGVTYEVTTDHGVRHVVRRTDLQCLVGLEIRAIPLRIVSGLGYMIAGSDRIEETFHELSRRAIQPIDVVEDHDDASASFRVTDRLGALIGVELPFRFKRFEVAAHVVADFSVATTVETDIPATSHLLSTGITVAWRF